MKKFHSEDEYQKLLNSLEREKPVLTNGVIASDKFNKLMKEDRLFYELVDRGVLIYIDNIEYYNIIYYMVGKRNISVIPKDKPVVVKSMYLKSRAKQQDTINAILLNAGFRRKDTMEQIMGKPEQILETIERPCEVAMRLLRKDGFKLEKFNPGRLHELFDIQKQIAEIPFYQFEYFSIEEYMREIADGHIICIVNSKDEICGIRHVFVENNSMYGWVAIKDVYKAEYGIALIFSEYSLKLAKKNGWKVMGWIAEDNLPSIRYHKKLGYTWTGRCMDEWVLEL